ncbi:MAG: class II fructose-1,6-bisphosphate aldolase [candidate division WOR-3 bacterium]|nr:MAG: class II fructose-1,6-bisphosphate aldolase [candidate division WOR-3 bacterium]
MLVTLNEILPQARKKGYAVGAFNTSNLEITQAILDAAVNMKSPVIVATSEKAIRYAGIENIASMVIRMAQTAKIPVALHLDHGKSYDVCRECIRHGYSSVMIDASYLSYQDNVKLTRRVVRFAHKNKVTVEAEIGRLAGIEDDVAVKKRDALYTDPQEAQRFALVAGCDALAVAIGTSHGAYKFKGKPKLRIDILKEIAQHVKIPLVLHGASGVKAQWINRVNKFGGTLAHTKGVPDTLLKKAVRHGIAKINTDTDLRIAFTAGVREHLARHPSDFDPRAVIGNGRVFIQQVVEERIRVFGSMNSA